MDKVLDTKTKALFKIERPFAIAMWDFSWIERRWPGAGYEDWNQALKELTDRGYDAVRIDAFPHLMAVDPYKKWTLKPVWNTQNWGSLSINKIRLHDDFRNFLQACRRHHVRVALSTWFREDVDNIRMTITSPEDHANIWIKTLDYIKEWGELDNLLYIDLCNEFPHDSWSPFFTKNGCKVRETKECSDWMHKAVDIFKKSYPEFPVTFSFTSPFENPDEDISYLDFIEPHVWMTNSSGFYKKIGYHFETFNDIGYTNLALYGKHTYMKNKPYYDQALTDEIKRVAEWSMRSGKPVISTECWSVVDYKDWPLLDWDWILDLNRLGVITAASTGRWIGMATSNFCGPQFVGMWREKNWHKELTNLIHNSQK